MGDYNDHCRLSGLIIRPGDAVMLFVPNRQYHANPHTTAYAEQQNLWRFRVDVLEGAKDPGEPYSVRLLSPVTYAGVGVYTLPGGGTWAIPDEFDEPHQPYAVFHQEVWLGALAHVCANPAVWMLDLVDAGKPGASLAFQLEVVLAYAVWAGREVFTPLIPTPDDHVDDSLGVTAHLAALTASLAGEAIRARGEE